MQEGLDLLYLFLAEAELRGHVAAAQELQSLGLAQLQGAGIYWGTFLEVVGAEVVVVNVDDSFATNLPLSHYII